MSNLEDYSEYVIKNDIDTVKRLFKEEYLYQFNKNGFTVFLQACNLGYTDIVKFFIEKEVDLTVDTSGGWNGLHWAAGYGHIDIVNLLLQKGMSKESETNKKLRPLHCAALHDQSCILRFLLTKGCDYNARNKDNKTPLDLATDLGNKKCSSLLKKWIEYDKIFNIVRQHKLEDLIDAFLEERVDVKEKNSGMTVLDVAVESKSFKCLERILLYDIKEDILLEALKLTLNKLKVKPESFRTQYRLYRSIIFNLKDEFDDLALMSIVNSPWILTKEFFLNICVQFNRKDMVTFILQMILEPGQILTQAEDISRTKGLPKITEIITQRKKFLASKEKASYNRLFVAIQDNRADVVRFILANNILDGNYSHPVAGAPLCFALSLGYGECVKALLDHGVSVNVKNKYHQTPLHIAIESGLSQFNATFVNNTNDLSQRDSFGYTALHQAIIAKDDAMCRLLLGKGANVVEPIMILQGDNADTRLNDAIFPLLQNENSMTLSLKLHGTILPSILENIDILSANSVSEDGSSVLHLVARLQLPVLCTQLIDIGANINLVNQRGNSPLHSLFVESFPDSWHNGGFLDTLRALVDGGASINLVNDEGLSPFLCALQTEDKVILGLILSRADHVECTFEDCQAVFNKQWPDILGTIFSLQVDNNKSHIISQSIEQGMEDFLDCLLGIVAPPLLESIVDDGLYNSAFYDQEEIFDKLTPLHKKPPRLLACGETVLTKLIIDNNMKYSLKLAESDIGEKYVDFPNHNDQTPLYLAAQYAHLKLCKCLVQESQSFNYWDQDGETALEKLFKSSTDTNDEKKLKRVEEIVKTMIRANVDINRVNKANVRAITFCRNANLMNKLELFDQRIRANRPQRPVIVDEDRNTCDICLDKPIDCQFGCGHPICHECADQLTISACPKCRKPIKARYPLFLS